MKVLHVAIVLLCIHLTYGFFGDLAQSQGKCVDLSDICKDMKALGNCNNKDFNAFARSDCPKSCGFCKPKPARRGRGRSLSKKKKSSETFSAMAGTCKDLSPLCEDLKKKHTCTSTYFKKYMSRECRETCELCKKGAAETDAETFSVGKVKKEKCKNVSPAKVCADLKKSHGCDNPFFVEHMRKECRKTCGFCKDDGKDDGDKTFSLKAKKPAAKKPAAKKPAAKKPAAKKPKKTKKVKKVKKGRTKWFKKGMCENPISKSTCIKYATKRRIKRKSIKQINNRKMPHGCLITTRRSKGKTVLKTVKFNRATSFVNCGRRGTRCVCYA